MTNTWFNSVKGLLGAANRWLIQTPVRALDEAYDAAIAIKRIEDEHFSGNRITSDAGLYGKSAQTYFQAELKRNLDIIKIRLTEFKASQYIVRLSNQLVTEVELNDTATDLRQINIIDQPGVILKKLRFIDEVVSRYEAMTEPAPLIVVAPPSKTSPPIVASPTGQTAQLSGTQLTGINDAFTGNPLSQSAKRKRDMKSLTDKTGVLPRSILETVDRIKRELEPDAEQDVVRDFRRSKARTLISIRLILLLIIVPLLTQQVAKSFVVGPLVDRFRTDQPQEAIIFLNQEMEEEALDELDRFQQRLRFEILIGQAAPLSEEEIAEQVQDKATEIKQEFFRASSSAIKNVFSDLLGVLAFGLVLTISRREVQVLKAFLDQLIYGLSDSAKAFIIILFTDIFVGFHSPHGWEVLLEGVSRHFGLPASRDFIFLFIATFPVILDTIFKYWIFRYLNRVSPSAVATYKNMNE